MELVHHCNYHCLLTYDQIKLWGKSSFKHTLVSGWCGVWMDDANTVGMRREQSGWSLPPFNGEQSPHAAVWKVLPTIQWGTISSRCSVDSPSHNSMGGNPHTLY